MLAKQKAKIDPRIIRTRNLLIKALDELMREKSFDAITVSEITQRATVNRVTFYAHFQDKYELLDASVLEMIRRQIDATLPQRNPFTEAKLAAVMRLVCGFLTEFVGHCPPPHGQMEPLIEKQIRSELYEVILGWLKSSPNRKLGSTEQIATVTSWAMYGAAAQWSQKGDRAPIDDFVRQVLPLIDANLKGLVPASPKKSSTSRAIAGGSGANALLRQWQLSYHN